jgi:hypothetical protein
MSPLTDKDIAELDNWLQSRVVEIAVRAIPQNAPAALREELLTIALKHATSMSWMTGEGAKQMGTIDGVSRVLWQSLKKEHPDITHDAVRSMMLDPRTIQYALVKFKDLNFGHIKDRKNPPAGKNRRPRTK